MLDKAIVEKIRRPLGHKRSISFAQSPQIHPFLKGNFAPVEEEYISQPCSIVSGEIPDELLGGQYVRNGGNPIYPPKEGRHYHWYVFLPAGFR